MATRDVIDSTGATIGQLTLPDETTEDQWSDALSHYTFVPTPPTQDQRIQAAVNEAVKLGKSILVQQASVNVQMGINQSGLQQEFMDYVHEFIHAMLIGSLYQGINLLNGYISDTSDEKTALSPFITNDRLTGIKNQLEAYLGVSLT